MMYHTFPNDTVNIGNLTREECTNTNSLLYISIVGETSLAQVKIDHCNLLIYMSISQC